MATEIRVPTLGESVTEATVGAWLKKVGDTVAADEPLVELETDKVTLEVPAPASGVIEKIEAQQGTVVGLGALLATIKADGKGAAAPAKAAPTPPRRQPLRRPARQSRSRLPQPKAPRQRRRRSSPSAASRRRTAAARTAA